MGLIISRFRKKTSTKEQLEQIQKDVAEIEEYRQHTQQRQKRLVGCLVLYSIVLYLVAAVVCYFYYFPYTLQHQLLYATPFIVFPFIVYSLKRLLTWHYRRKISKNEEKLKELHQRQEKILEQVMETETYKVAKEILEKYAPEQIRHSQLQLHKGSQGMMNQRLPTPVQTPVQHPDVRRRIVGTPQAVPGGGPGIRVGLPSGMPHQTPAFTPKPPITAQSVPSRPLVGMGVRSGVATPGPLVSGAPQGPNSIAGDLPSSTPLPPLHTSISRMGGPPGPPMPRPVLPRERGVLDRFIEYLVGDGPANRFALVCRQCESHNGMALKDEFQYLAFRCAYCFYWNPARKQRPAAPRLENLVPPLPPTQDQEEEEEQDSSSGEEEEEEEGGEEESESNNGSGEEEEEEEEEEEGCVTSEVSSGQATSSQEGSLEDLAKSTPSSDLNTSTTTTSEQTTSSGQTTSSDQTSDEHQKGLESSDAITTLTTSSSTTSSSTNETE